MSYPLRSSAGVMNPEEEDDEYVAPALGPSPCGDDDYYSAARMAARAERPVRPLEPVAAMTYAEARAHAEKVTKAAALDKAFKHHPQSAADYKEAEWDEVPDTKRPEPLSTAWFNCVKRYRFIKYGDGNRLIIEVELMSGTTLRNIIKLSQVKSILTKGNTHNYQRIEEVIIDLRHSHTAYAPEQLKFKFAGDENALAFHMALMDAL